MTVTARKKKAGQRKVRLPAFCDFSCPHARFAPAESVGACRREQAVYCGLFKRYNNKNSACLERKEAGSPAS
jgi:hypothetical protein